MPGRKKLYTDEELKERIRESKRRYRQSEIGKKKNIEHVKKYKQKPQAKEKQKEYNKNYQKTDKYKEYKREYTRRRRNSLVPLGAGSTLRESCEDNTEEVDENSE